MGRVRPGRDPPPLPPAPQRNFEEKTVIIILYATLTLCAFCMKYIVHFYEITEIDYIARCHARRCSHINFFAHVSCCASTVFHPFFLRNGFHNWTAYYFLHCTFATTSFNALAAMDNTHGFFAYSAASSPPFNFCGSPSDKARSSAETG